MKRPLMGLGIALTAGVAVGWSEGNWTWVLLIAAVISFILIKRWTESSNKYLLGLSVFFVVGICRTLAAASAVPSMDSEIHGVIQKVQEKENVYHLILKSESKEKVLVVVSKKEVDTFRFYKGQVYRVCGDAEHFEKAGNPGQFDVSLYYKSLNVSYRIWAEHVNLQEEGYWFWQKMRWLEDLKDRMCQFYDEAMSSENSGLLKAAVLGERSGLDEDLKRYYQENGWMHLITTSGLHLSFVAMNIYKRLRKMTAPIGVSTGIALCTMFLYGYMTDFGDSMLRAMGTMILELVSKLLGRKTDGWTNIFGLAGAMLLAGPEKFLSVGFWLTYTAVAGMEFGKWLAKNIHIKESLWIQVGIFAVTLPVLLCSMYEIPMFGFFYNFFMIPLISVIVPMAFASGLFGVFHLFFLEQGAVIVLKMMDGLFMIIHRLPANVWHCGCPQIWQLAVYGIGLVVMVGLIKKKKIGKGIAIFVVSCVCLMFVRVRLDQIVFADVGQGDGICMMTDTGQTVLIDGGSSDVKNVYTYRLEPLLKYYGVQNIDAWFLSHADADHVSGIKEAIEKNARIGHIFLPDGLPDKKFEDIKNMAKRKGIPVSTILVGEKVVVGNYTIECLYPKKSWCTGNGNEDSMVLDVSVERKYKTTHVLFTGDIGQTGEQCMMERVNLEDTDVLKVAHHGSSGGTTKALLSRIKPEWAIISCGKDNVYGHPHEETLMRLAQNHCRWLTTSAQGAIIIQITNHGYELYSYQKQD